MAAFFPHRACEVTAPFNKYAIKYDISKNPKLLYINTLAILTLSDYTSVTDLKVHYLKKRYGFELINLTYFTDCIL